MASSSEVHLVCGPIEDDLLELQSQHVSTHIWNRAPERKLIVRHANVVSTDIPPQLMELLTLAGFGWIPRLSHMKVSTALINALVERWRPETHTFHMPFGECTITLQDVAILTGLRVDGQPLIMRNDKPRRYLVECFGHTPPRTAFKEGYGLRLSWLTEHFGQPDPNVQDPVYWQRHARAWICRCLGGVLFMDAGSTCVNIRWLTYLRDVQAIGNYAWGAAALSYLYRSLCKATNYDTKNIGGFLALLQLWAWERIPKLTPSAIPPIEDAAPIGVRWTTQHHALPLVHNVIVIRRTLDTLRRRDFIWCPYSDDLIGQLPNDCTQGRDIWESICPLLCLLIIEWHQPDRAMRQFGFQQPIPNTPSTPPQVHHLTLRGKNADHWTIVIDACTLAWNNRCNSCFQHTLPQQGLLSSQSDYMRWYMRKGLPRVDPISSPHHAMADIAEQIVYHTTDDYIKGLALRQLNLADVADRYVEPVVAAPEAGQAAEVPSMDVPHSSRETKGPRRRRRVDPVKHVIPPVHERLPGQYYGPSQDTRVYPSQSQQPLFHQYPHSPLEFQPPSEYHPAPDYQPHSPQLSPQHQPVHDAWLDDPPTDWLTQAQEALFGSTYTTSSTLPGDTQTPPALADISYDNVYIQQQFLMGGVDLGPKFSTEASSSATSHATVRRNPFRGALTRRPPYGTSSKTHGHDRQHVDDNNDDNPI